MPIESPQLDDLTFDRTVDELERRIPVYAPEWTDYNDSDPGKSLIQLFAYLAEQVGYRLNRVPEKNYIELLRLLGIRLEPARAATTRLSFLLSTPSTLVGFTLPPGAQATAKHGDPPPTFETDLALDVVPAQMTALVTTLNPYLWDLRLTDATTNAHDPLTPSTTPATTPAKDSHWHSVAWDGAKPPLKSLPLEPATLEPHLGQPYLWVGLDYNDAPDAGFLGVRVTLTVQLDDDEQPDPSAHELCGPEQRTPEPAPTITWLAYYDTALGEMRSVPGVIDDTTAQLTRSGTIRFLVPATLGALPPFVDLQSPLSPDALSTCNALASELGSVIIGDASDPNNVVVSTGPHPKSYLDLSLFQSAVTRAVTNVQTATQVQIPHPLDPALHDPTKQRAWLRITVADPNKSAKLRMITFNAVPATNAISVENELVGRSTGRPGQTFALANRNALAGSLELAVLESGDPGALMTAWQVGDLDAAGPFDRIVDLDPEAGVLTFGDGRRGRIPPLVPNAGTIVALHYRFGGGKAGEVGVGEIAKLDAASAGFSDVVNHVAARGGADAETLDHAKLRARKLLASRTRAVTAADFEWFAKATPTVRVARAIVVPLRRPLATGAVVGPNQPCGPTDPLPCPPAPILEPPPHKAGAALTSLTKLLAKTVPGRCGPLPTQPSGLATGVYPGVVSVVVVPDLDPAIEPEPMPVPSFLREVCKQLDRYRLVTTEIYVVPPQYMRICKMNVSVLPAAGYTRSQLQQLIGQRLAQYLHPLIGGEDGTGYPFGADVHISDLQALITRVEGVERVDTISADFSRTKTNVKNTKDDPRQGRLVPCPVAPDEVSHVQLGDEECTSFDADSLRVSTVA